MSLQQVSKSKELSVSQIIQTYVSLTFSQFYELKESTWFAVNAGPFSMHTAGPTIGPIPNANFDFFPKFTKNFPIES
jgi:hypothetical protein